MKIHLVLYTCLYFSASATEDNRDNCSCGTSNRPKQRIIGGDETLKNEYPWMVALFEKDPYWKQYCGGSIITSRHILTAGHCAHGRAHRPIRAAVGMHDLQEWEHHRNATIQIVHMTIHEGYNDNILQKDIALMITADKIDFRATVSPLCLPAAKLMLYGQNVKVLGWGLTKSNGVPSNVLREVDMEVIPLETCKKIWEKTVAIQPSQLCTYRDGKDSCNQDSGGPLVWINPETNLYTQVALVSYGDLKCGGPKPAVSTDVSAFVDWINDHVAATEEKVCTGY